MTQIDIGRPGKIRLRAGRNPQIAAVCADVPGAYLSKREGAWTFPLSIETCQILREKFGAGMRVGKALSEWYAAEAAARAALAKAGRRTKRTDLPRLARKAPALYKAVTEARPYQSPGARFICDGRAVILGDEQGLGKTLEVMAAIVESGVKGPYLVVSPKTAARSVWPREIARWLRKHKAYALPQSAEARNALLDKFLAFYRQGTDRPVLNRMWLSIHPEALLTKVLWVCPECRATTPHTKKHTSVLGCGHKKPRTIKTTVGHVFPQLFEIEWGAVVVDECHESLVRKSGTPTQRRNGFDRLRVRKDGLKIAASGTPLRNRPWHLIGILGWLQPKKYRGTWRWIRQYWETGGYSGYEIRGFLPEREKMLWSELGGVMLRRTKAEVAKDLPPKSYVGTPLDPHDENSPIGIWLPMEGAQRRAYEGMLKDSIAKIKNGTLEATGTLAERTRLSQLACAYGKFGKDEDDFLPTLPSNKFDWCEQFLEEMGIPDDPQGKVVIVSRFTRLLNMFSFGLKASQNGMGCLLTGAQSPAQRDRIIQAFNRPAGTDSPHVMFLNVKAGGSAITLDSADDMILLDESGPDIMAQVEDRIHRVSNPRKVRYYYLRSEGTTDVGQAVVFAETAKGGRRLLDERRGVEYFRKVLEESDRADN